MFLNLHFKRSLNHSLSHPLHHHNHRMVIYMAIILSIIALTISTSALSSGTSGKGKGDDNGRAPASVNKAKVARNHHPPHSTRREIASLRSPHLLKGTQPGTVVLPSFPSNTETRYLLLHPQTLEEERHLGYAPEHEDLPANFHHAPEQLIMGGNVSPALKQDPYYVPPGLLLFNF